MREPNFIPENRRQVIAQRIADGQAVLSGALALEFHVSDDAIRRDLRALAAEGKCERVYGGALPISRAHTPVAQRNQQDLNRKVALCHAGAQHIKPGQTVFLDAGSTVAQITPFLPQDAGLIVVTNAVAVAAAVAHRTDITLHLIGGKVSPHVGGSVDGLAQASLTHFHFDLCFLGTCALHPDVGFAAFDPDDAAFKRQLLERSRATILMVTTEKIGTTAPYVIGAMSRADYLLVEHDVAPKDLAALQARIATTQCSAPARKI